MYNVEKIKLIIKENKKYELFYENNDVSFTKRGIAEIDVIYEQEQTKCFELQFKEINMASLSFYVGENGTYTVTYNSTQSIPSATINVTNNQAVLNIPDGVYTINSVTFTKPNCTQTYSTPIPVNCPTITYCNCDGSNGGNPIILSVLAGENGFYTINYNACNMSPFIWEVLDGFNQIIQTGSTIPTSASVIVELDNVLIDGEYTLRIFSTGCVGEAYTTFDVVHNSGGGGGIDVEGVLHMRELVLDVNGTIVSDTKPTTYQANSKNYKSYYVLEEQSTATESFINVDLSAYSGQIVLIRKFVVDANKYPTYASFLSNWWEIGKFNTNNYMLYHEQALINIP